MSDSETWKPEQTVLVGERHEGFDTRGWGLQGSLTEEEKEVEITRVWVWVCAEVYSEDIRKASSNLKRNIRGAYLGRKKPCT